MNADFSPYALNTLFLLIAVLHNKLGFDMCVSAVYRTQKKRTSSFDGRFLEIGLRPAFSDWLVFEDKKFDHEEAGCKRGEHRQNLRQIMTDPSRHANELKQQVEPEEDAIIDQQAEQTLQKKAETLFGGAPSRMAKGDHRIPDITIGYCQTIGDGIEYSQCSAMISRMQQQQ